MKRHFDPQWIPHQQTIPFRLQLWHQLQSTATLHDCMHSYRWQHDRKRFSENPRCCNFPWWFLGGNVGQTRESRAHIQHEPLCESCLSCANYDSIPLLLLLGRSPSVSLSTVKGSGWVSSSIGTNGQQLYNVCKEPYRKRSDQFNSIHQYESTAMNQSIIAI